MTRGRFSTGFILVRCPHCSFQLLCGPRATSGTDSRLLIGRLDPEASGAADSSQESRAAAHIMLPSLVVGLLGGIKFATDLHDAQPSRQLDLGLP